ncbi:ras-related protein Rab-9B-like [Melanaphis sacchari]|uniref:small monomeric GTPase n=1 Tax=Melanaphis sacchari TaxID=742174 RepID=A0A2H8TVH8_9HEMI|nr:ras-related protein Rab-9B-like [Melanaphis sacchari]
MKEKTILVKQNPILKVVILGNSNVGKSCLMNRFVSNSFSDHTLHTLGVEFLQKDLDVNGIVYTLQIWDTAGQERFRTLRTPFYRGTDICLLTFAVDDIQSFKTVDSWKKEFLQYSRTTDVNFPFIVVATKVDLQDRVISKDEADKWCSEYLSAPYVETSSKTDMNIETAFTLAVEVWASTERPSELKISHTNLVKLSRPINGSAACPTAEIVSPKCC